MKPYTLQHPQQGASSHRPALFLYSSLPDDNRHICDTYRSSRVAGVSLACAYRLRPTDTIGSPGLMLVPVRAQVPGKRAGNGMVGLNGLRWG